MYMLGVDFDYEDFQFAYYCCDVRQEINLFNCTADTCCESYTTLVNCSDFKSTNFSLPAFNDFNSTRFFSDCCTNDTASGAINAFACDDQTVACPSAYDCAQSFVGDTEIQLYHRVNFIKVS